MSRWRSSVVAVLLALASCQDAVVPNAGIPTLDDAASDDFVAVAAGKEHTCALTSDGTAYCWGSNESGQLGVPAGTSRCMRGDRPIPCESRPVAVSGGLKFRKITAGALHTCAITTTARVYCWGDNLFGQLGDPAVRQTSEPNPVVLADPFDDIAAGGVHTCAVRTDGTAFCWGSNIDGQIGVTTIGAGTASPLVVQTTQRFASIAAGARRTCARTGDGGVYCWGATWVARQGGIEVVRDESNPVRIPNPATRQLAVGGVSTCGVTDENVAYCWEGNPSGTLGNGTTIGSVLATKVRFEGAMIMVSVGNAHACGIAASGRAYCWGADTFGQLGVSPALLNAQCFSGLLCSPAPIAVSGWREFTDVSAGQGDHTCAVTTRGTVYCWGAGGLGQRGDGRLSNEWAPARVIRP
ncbi:MAG TPA: hypothetical protein VJ867_00460 [Gemmatimonadaceae bacterium]|nr:hypothetical protein [Gemmatimonadaceae bacterium]